MRKSIITFIITGIVISYSCNSTKSVKKLETCNELLQENLKIEIFHRCINHSYKLTGKDISTPNSIEYGFQVYNELDSISQIIINAIVQDSIENTYKRWGEVNWETDSIYIENLYNEGILGSKTLKYCLEYYNSNELDSLVGKMACRIDKAWKNWN